MTNCVILHQFLSLFLEKYANFIWEHLQVGSFSGGWIHNLIFLLSLVRVQRDGVVWKMMLVYTILSCMLSALLFRWYEIITPLQLASN